MKHFISSENAESIVLLHEWHSALDPISIMPPKMLIISIDNIEKFTAGERIVIPHPSIDIRVHQFGLLSSIYFWSDVRGTIQFDSIEDASVTASLTLAGVHSGKLNGLTPESIINTELTFQIEPE